MKKYRNIISTGLVALIIGLLLGAVFFNKPSNKDEEDSEHKHAEQENQVWTCSMHPQIQSPEPGLCPICGMDLIPLENNSEEGLHPDEIQMTDRALKLADVQTSIVGNEQAAKVLQLTGKIQADERLVFNQTAHFPGRIEKLFVNFTGEYITKGQKIASIYSPELATAQEELFEAQKFGNEALVKSAKKKLRLWKLSETEINKIIQNKKIITEIPIRADISGVVSSKKIKLGSHVNAGTELFEVTNLDKVWAVFDAYENDLQWVSKGDSIFFTTASVSGKLFKTKVSFIDPVINPKTRVALLRTEINNTEALLKPEMLLNGELRAKKQDDAKSLIVPKSAVMWTGSRSLVYIKTKEAPSTFLMREVTLGSSLGDSYIILEGLSSGDEIVTNGTFTVDAAAQLQGKKSMMNRTGKAEQNSEQDKDADKQDLYRADTPSAFKEQLSNFVNQYFEIKDALVNSDLEEANKMAQSTLASLKKIDMKLLKGDAHIEWMELQNTLSTELEQIIKAKKIETQRDIFIKLSEDIITSIQLFGISGSTIYIQRCPMANNNEGSRWLSASKEVLNPYFGEAMLKCGEVITEIKPNN